MNHLAISGVIVFITSLCSAVFVLIKGPKKDISFTWGLFSLSVACWGLGLFKGFITGTEQVALFWGRFLNLSAVFIAIFFFHFVVCFTNNLKNKKNELFLYYLILVSIFFIAIIYPKTFVSNVRPILSFKYYPAPGFLYYIFTILFVYLETYGVILLFKDLRLSSGTRKNQIKYLLMGVFVGFAGGSSTFFPIFKIPIYPLGTYLVTIYVGTVAYAIVRHQLMDIEVVIKKTLVFGSLFMIVFGIFIGITLLTQELLAGGRLLGLALSSLVIIFTVRPLEIFLINITNKYLFQKEYDPQQLLKEISQGIVGKIDLESLRDFIARVLQEKIKLENIIIVEEDTILSEWHMNNNTPLLYDTMDYMARRKKIDISHLKNHMRELKASVSVPVFFKDAAFWFILLGGKKSGRAYSSEDIGLLDALSHEISVAIENAMNFQELKRSQMELLRQNNLKFVSVLVKGLAHEIFNPLMPLMHKIEDLEGEDLLKIYEIYEKNKAKLDKDEEMKFKSSLISLRESTKSLKANASHIHLIVDTLSKLEKGDEKTIGPLDIKSFFKEIVSLFGLEVEPNLQQGVLINQNIAQNLPPVKANPTLLKQIFINLYKNSCYAMKNSPIKTIDIDCEISEANENELKIIFSDTGAGIPPAVISKIFSYGFTTKGSKGSGIGLNQCKAIIEKFGGTIIIESEESKGTRIIINVPIWEEGVKNVA